MCSSDLTRTSDIRFNKYQAVRGAWLSPEVVFLVDDEERWFEEYTEVKTDVPLAATLFDPRQWKKARSS